MKTKRQLRKENEQLRNRIADLEERLCPCQAHEWVKAGHRYVPGRGVGDGQYINVLQCKTCGKNTEVVEW